jgi:glycosyltransferase involved in cell wall biosynthesis
MILRIHYNFHLKSGADYHVLKLMDTFAKYGGDTWKNHLLLITEENNKIKLKLYKEGDIIFFENNSDVSKYLNDLVFRLNIEIIHIHSQPSSRITKMILDLNLPVFRSMHEAMIICPGWAKYWLKEDKPCEISFGKACLINAYTKKCTKSRNPIHLLSSYNNVKFELEYATNKYKAIFVCSDYMIKESIKSNISPAKLIKVPSPQYDHFNNELKIINNKIVIVYSGRLSKQKGVKYLIEAVSLLKSKGYDDFEVLIFGEGPDEVYLKKLTDKLSLNKFVTFFGWVDRHVLVDYFKKAHISVVPSTYPDTFPNTVAESMLAKLVVIAFDSGGTCEWFEHMKSGIQVENKNGKVLFEEIEKLINDRDLIKNIGENARTQILLNHSLKRTFEVYSENYSKVLVVH